MTKRQEQLAPAGVPGTAGQHVRAAPSSRKSLEVSFLPSSTVASFTLASTATTAHLTRAQLAQRWCTSVGHLANLASRGDGPPYLKLGARVLYRLTDVEAHESARIVRPVAA